RDRSPAASGRNAQAGAVAAVASNSATAARFANQRQTRVHRRYCSGTDRGIAMALSSGVRRQRLPASLPESTEVRLELQDSLAGTGMAPSDFARRINYARETGYQFLNGHYSRISSNDGLIRTAIRDFIAAHPIATPVISAGKLYETENARLLRRYFYEALD